MSVGLKWIRHLVCLKKNLWAVSRRRKPSLSLSLYPSKNSPSSSLARVCFITLVIPTMRRAGEAAVLYIWTRRLARRLFLLLFPASIYEVHTLDRPSATIQFIFFFHMNLFFYYFYSVALSWQQITVMIFTQNIKRKFNTQKTGVRSVMLLAQFGSYC